jgi:hypothetical protein
MKYSPYSFSKINTFFTCQKKFEFTYVNKIPVDGGYSDPSYFKRGRFIHAYIANRLKGNSILSMKSYDVIASDKLKLVADADKALENELIILSFNFNTTEIEIPMLLDADLNPILEKSKAAISGFVDYYAVHDDYGLIVDWKSGKHRGNPDFSQLELYAIWVLQKHPQLSEIDLMFYYIEHDKFELKTITTEHVATLKYDVSNKIKIIESTEVFLTTKSQHCTDCAFLNSCEEQTSTNHQQN